MNPTRFSYRYHTSENKQQPTQQIEDWLKHWGVIYQRDTIWRAYDPRRDESFRFKLDFILTPMHGRKPTDYLLLEIITPHPAPIAQRAEARRQLLRTLWPGRMVCLDAQLLRADVEAAQLRLLNAL